MPHTKVYGYCENLCNVEVEPKSITENLYNENMLLGGDFVNYPQDDNFFSIWDSSGFTLVGIGMLIDPSSNGGYLRQKLVASSFATPIIAGDYFPITISVETTTISSTSERVVHSVTIDNFSSFNESERTLYEIESGKYLKCKFESYDGTAALRIYTTERLSNSFFISRVKAEHGNHFTGFKDNVKGMLLQTQINSLMNPRIKIIRVNGVSFGANATATVNLGDISDITDSGNVGVTVMGIGTGNTYSCSVTNGSITGYTLIVKPNAGTWSAHTSNLIFTIFNSNNKTIP